MTDLLQRLRAADPCPAPVAYDDAVAQRNIDALVRTDLTVRSADSAPRPRRRPWLAVAAVAVLLAVGGTVVGVEISRDRTPVVPAVSVGAGETFSSNGVSFEYPTAWTSYPAGIASTMSYGLAYLSTTPFPAVCATTSTTTGETTACHPPEPDLSAGGVFVDWTYRATPGLTLDGFTGDPTVIGGVDARVDRSTLPEECRPTHAVAGVQAALDSASNNVLVMTACVGPGDVDADLAAVDRMLASLQIDR